MLSKVVAAALTLIVFGSVCAGERRIEADFCILVSVPWAEAAEIYGRFDGFAQRRKLSREPASGERGARTYLTADGKSRIWVSAMTAVGRWKSGVEVAHFSMQEDKAGKQLISELGQFVRDEIRVRWRVRNCYGIRGFTPPVMIIRAQNQDTNKSQEGDTDP